VIFREGEACFAIHLKPLPVLFAESFDVKHVVQYYGPCIGISPYGPTQKSVQLCLSDCFTSKKSTTVRQALLSSTPSLHYISSPILGAS